VQRLAFVYDFAWAIIVLAGGAAVAVAGALTDRIAMVGVGIGISLFGAAWLAFDVWPSRRTH
jgi:hypothetical protein